MVILIDTSVLVRMANQTDAAYPVALAAVAELHRRSEVLHITSQNLIEFRNVATRPLAVNGLGMTLQQAELAADLYESRFPLLPETDGIHSTWKSIVTALGVIGKQVHDARLVAICHVHQIFHLLTFNSNHFTRLAQFGPGIVILDPAKL